jgi:hypothetical protein
MTTMATPTTDVPVRRSVTVKTGVEHAFRVFTEGFDSWWPRTHHIGKSPMTRGVIEPFVGGRLYSEQVDGTDCPWGQVTTWDLPRRFVCAWQSTHTWGFEPDLAKAVVKLVTPLDDGTTRVVEHRHFDRGIGAAEMRTVGGDGGWRTAQDVRGEQQHKRLTPRRGDTENTPQEGMASVLIRLNLSIDGSAAGNMSSKECVMIRTFQC